MGIVAEDTEGEGGAEALVTAVAMGIVEDGEGAGAEAEVDVVSVRDMYWQSWIEHRPAVTGIL